MQKNRFAVVGAFVIGGLLLFAVGLFMIGNRRMLFTDTVQIYAEFEQISALANGAKVRVAGMDAGEVEEIRVPAGPAGTFRVTLRVREDLHPLIRTDSVASIQNDGLVGNKFIQIQTGSEGAPQIPERGTIRSREPFDIADLMQMMSDTIVTVNAMLIDVKGRIDEALVALAVTASDAQEIINEAGEDVKVILASTERIAVDLKEMVGDIRNGEGSIGKLIRDDSLYQSAKAIVSDAEKAMAMVREATVEVREAIAGFRGEGGPMKGVGALTADAQQTLRAASDAMQDLAEVTEALKHNFLFRGFFNRRGYFDLSDVTVAQYREGALTTDDRRVHRIWVSDEVLFETGPNGQEQLSEGGKARLDSAMSHFLRYPRNSPFVVEGYAQALTQEERYLISSSRAQTVRDYLTGKYGLDARYVATMPMGAEADGSPAGDQWAGVALAMFVPARAS